MIEIKPVIIEKGLVEKGLVKNRQTVRAIIFNASAEVLMIYSKKFRDYTFAGGGIKEFEDEKAALKRELKEELGAESINIIKRCYQTTEKCYEASETNIILLQRSVYYLVEVLVFAKQKLTTLEIAHGVEPRWVSIEQALQQNKQVSNDKQHQKKGLKTVLVRENTILNKIKESRLCENLK